MRLGRFSFEFKREPKPLPAEAITLLSQLVDTRLLAIEANMKETRQRLETVYRKVYRDLAKDGEAETQPTPPRAAPTFPFRPKAGDPLEEGL